MMSCTKDKAIKEDPKVINTVVPHSFFWEDRIVQDTAFRFGKWRSVTPLTNQSTNPNLDTIWFINDTLAGWTGFVSNSNAYLFSRTYFPDMYHITHVYPDFNYPSRTDSVTLQCGMNFAQDTFAIYWSSGAPYLPFYIEKYVKAK
jgi:hypothetical protein